MPREKTGQMPMDAKTNQEEIEEIRQADASVKKMEDFTSPDKLYQELISKYPEIPSFR